MVKMEDVSRSTANPAPVPNQTRVSAKGTISLIELLLSPLKDVVSKSVAAILYVPGSNPCGKTKFINNIMWSNRLIGPPTLS